MRSPHLVLCAFVLAASVCLRGTGRAQADKPKASPYEFSIRSYPLPVLKFRGELASKPIPEMPPPEAGEDEQDHFLKRSHEIMNAYILRCGLELPPGSLTSYDPATGTLCLRTTNAVHGLIEAFSDSSVREAPKHLSWRLEMVEAASADVRAMVKQCQGRVDHGRQLDELLAKGVAITTMRGETKGGMQMTAHQGGSFGRPKRYSVNTNGQVQADSDLANSGVHIFLDPVIGEDGSTDINCFLQYWPTAPRMRLAQLTAGSAPKVEAEWLDLPAFTTKFATTFQNGETRLIGVWDLEILEDPAKAGRSQAAFFRAHSVSLLRAPEPRLESMLRKRGEILVPTPKAAGPAPETKPEPPPGMVVRIFRVPVDFETMSGCIGWVSRESSEDPDSKTSVDPFVEDAASDSTKRVFRRLTIEEMLKGQGIPFPSGSYARTSNVAPRELTVCNLPENLDLTESFLRSLMYQRKVVQTTVEIIEADAALLRRLAGDTEAVADHSAALKTLDDEIDAGRARVFRTAWIETKGGQPATWENVVLTKIVSKFGASLSASSAPAKEEDKAEVKKPAQQGLDSDLQVASEEEHVGFEVEIDPVIGEGGVVDLNLIVKADTTPMRAMPAATAPPPGDQRLATVNTVRHGMAVDTSMSLHKGVPRLLTIYQPTTTEGPAANVLHAVFVRTDIAVLDLSDE